MEGKLKDHGYRATTGRKTILDVLANTKENLSAEDIYLKVHSIYPSIGLASVYRTLEILVNVGIVHKFNFRDRIARYKLIEGTKGKGHHHHLICTVCHKIIDYADFVDEELALLKQTEKHLSKKYNFKIISHMVQYYGLCEKCIKKEE